MAHRQKAATLRQHILSTRPMGLEALHQMITTLGRTTRHDDNSTDAAENDFDAHTPWVTEMILVYVMGANGYAYRDRDVLIHVLVGRIKINI